MEKYYMGVSLNKTDDCGSLRDAALRRAAELAPFSVSQQEVEEEYRLLMADFRHRLTYDSMATGKPLYLYEGLEELTEDLKREALFRVKARLVLDDVINREGLAVSAEELEAEGAAIAARQGVSLEEVRDLLGAGLHMVERDLLERKALDLIADHAVFS